MQELADARRCRLAMDRGFERLRKKVRLRSIEPRRLHGVLKQSHSHPQRLKARTDFSGHGIAEAMP